MKQSLTTRRPETTGRRVVPGRRYDLAGRRTILVAGVVHSMGRLHEVATTERVRLRDLAAQAARHRVDAIVIGSSSPPSAALEAIDALKSRAQSAVTPVLHLFSGHACG